MTRLCVGTETGVVVVGQDPAGAWSVAGRGLEGLLVCGLATSPTVPGLILASTRGSGLWRSRDGGQSWTRRGQGSLPPKLRAPVIVGDDGRLMYVGSEPIGLFRSRDGGESWEEITVVRQIAQEKRWEYPMPQVEPHVRGMAVSRKQPNVILLAIQVGGILRSEDDGATWENVSHEALDPDVHTVVFAPNGSGTVFAATGGGGRMYPPPAGLAAYRSDDAGRTWRPITAALDRTYSVPLSVRPDRPEVLFLGTARNTPPSWAGRPDLADAAVFRSKDGGQSWERLQQGLPSPMWFFPEVIEINPVRPDEVFLGIGGEGTQLLPPERRKGLIFSSEDGGDSWGQVPIELPSIFALSVV